MALVVDQVVVPTGVTSAEAERLRLHHCGAKRRLSPADAFRASARARAAHPSAGYSAYQCCWCGSWHYGHTPAMASIELLARYLRFGVAS